MTTTTRPAARVDLTATSSDGSSPAARTDGDRAPSTTAQGGPAQPAQGSAATTVLFVGTGPGDPALLTVRAVQALAGADVVVRDRLLGGAALARLCRPGVQLVDGGEDASGAPLPAPARLSCLVEAVGRASSGATVVRLVDGDPGTSAGLVAEVEAARSSGARFELVPGLPLLTAVPTYAGVPLAGPSVRGVHLVPAGGPEPDWTALTAAEDVVVVERDGAPGPGEVADRLLRAGRSAATPVSVTSGGTTTEQRTVVTTLGAVATELAGAAAGRTVTVVGPSVGQRDALSWFETKPLFGWRVLVPRTKQQAGALSDELRGYGAVAEEVPTIQVEPPRTPQQMDRAVKGLVTGRYEWIAFTSVNAVRAVREKFEEYGLDARAFSGIKVAAVGEPTARALLEYGVRPDLVPAGEQSAQGLLDQWAPYDAVFDPINRVFLPRADIATETLAAGLVELGWEVDDVTAYRTVRAAPPAAPVRDAIKSGGFDAVLFTSSSTVRNLVGIAGKPHASTVIACIGPATARTAEEHGLRVDVLATSPSVTELAAALGAFGEQRRLEALEAGETEWRPSLRRPSPRRRR